MKRFAPYGFMALAAVFALSSCATSGGDASSAQSLTERWKGQSADMFFSRYGSPFAEYGERNGGVRYTWRKRYTMTSADGAGPDVRVCEIDLLTDTTDRIRDIVPTRNSKIRADETASCEGAFEVPING